MDRHWQLNGKGILYGSLFLERIDQPWYHCRFEPTNAFQEIERLFLEEIRVLNENTFDEWKQCYDAIDLLQLELRSGESQRTIDDFLLHIEGKHAWFRYE